MAEGFVTKIVSGVDALIGLASGLILGALIMYYLLKDGTSLRRSVVAQIAPSVRDEVDSFITEACQILRSYGRGRTAMSAIVSVVVGIASLLLGLPLVLTIVVVNFIGGYIPYIGAFLGGGLAVIVAYGEGGLGLAAVMLLVVLAANLLLENFVEPRVMGRTLDIHPMLVIIVTALGGFLFGIVGLLLAVPFTVIAANGIGRLRERGFFGSWPTALIRRWRRCRIHSEVGVFHECRRHGWTSCPPGRAGAIDGGRLRVGDPGGFLARDRRLVALRFRIGLRVIGLIMGFGAGVLISAVAFDLVEEAVEKSSGHGGSSRASSPAAASSSAATG